MARLRVRFEWLTGLKQPIFRNVRLVGSWDRHGRYSDQTRTIAMKKFTAPDRLSGLARRRAVRRCAAWVDLPLGRHRRHPTPDKRMGHPDRGGRPELKRAGA